jgi:diphosphomevalonate decarboxylase
MPKESDLTIDAQTIVNQILPHRLPAQESAEAFAPANIALCKYWGKRNEALKLPLTGSLSVSLGQLGTRMRISLDDRDRLSINGTPQLAESNAYKRLFAFLDLFRVSGTAFRVESHNSIPMAAGLASSASAFAATVNTLNQLYGWDLGDSQRSILSRLGSGSASRSICPGFVEWQAGERPDGMDSTAVALESVWPEFRVGILTLSAAEKPVGSSEGMQRTLETSMLFQSWPNQVAKDLPVIREAVLQKDFKSLGPAAEQNAMAMHATMIAAWPPIIYWQPESVATLRRVHGLRADGVEVFATMDAGPNVKLLFEAKTENDLRQAFPDLKVISPFAD